MREENQLLFHIPSKREHIQHLTMKGCVYPKINWNENKNSSLKQFQLYASVFGRNRFFAIKELNGRELLVRNTHNGNMAKLGQDFLDTLDMHLRILHAGTMTCINGHLEHSKAIALKVFPKLSIRLAVFLGFRRKIKKH